MLNRRQIQRLAHFLITDHGSRLPEPELIECVHAMLDDIAGFESASDTVIQTTIDQIRSAYHDQADQQHDQDGKQR